MNWEDFIKTIDDLIENNEPLDGEIAQLLDDNIYGLLS